MMVRFVGLVVQHVENPLQSPGMIGADSYLSVELASKDEAWQLVETSVAEWELGIGSFPDLWCRLQFFLKRVAYRFRVRDRVIGEFDE